MTSKSKIDLESLKLAVSLLSQYDKTKTKQNETKSKRHNRSNRNDNNSITSR
jgi:hypothetical protein